MKKLGTILLIDDDTICCYLNRMLLEEMNIFENVVSLTDSQEALDYLKRMNSSGSEDADNHPALIFLDLNMPGLDGFQVLEQLNKMGGGQDRYVKRVVILSSSMHPADQKRAGRYAIFDYLVKPLTQTKIKEVIDRLLDSSPPGPKTQDKMTNPQMTKNRPPLEKPAAESGKKKQEKKGGTKE